MELLIPVHNMLYIIANELTSSAIEMGLAHSEECCNLCLKRLLETTCD